MRIHQVKASWPCRSGPSPPRRGHSVPAVVWVGDVRAEQAEAVLIAADRGLAAALDAAEICDEFLDDGRCPRPGELVGVRDEPTNQADSAVDGVVVEVAAQLLLYW